MQVKDGPGVLRRKRQTPRPRNHARPGSWIYGFKEQQRFPEME